LDSCNERFSAMHVNIICFKRKIYAVELSWATGITYRFYNHIILHDFVFFLICHLLELHNRQHWINSRSCLSLGSQGDRFGCAFQPPRFESCST
jgi:hypothetical protein